MIAWAPAEPERVGEVVLFEHGEGRRVLGRGAPDGAGSERVEFQRQQPDVSTKCGPLESPGLSRDQLRIRVEDQCVHIERIGKCTMEVAGRRVEQCVLAPGESLLLKGQMLLYCTLCPRKLEPLHHASLLGIGNKFGEADVYGLVGESPITWRLRDQLAWMAKADEHTLLLGGSGSGKELCARAVHGLSVRAQGPFVARNAATIPAGIVDAELFGNVKNYPNPGMAERPGLIGAANNGTLFLDEIGELPQAMQANLLRVLDEGGEYHNLGGTTTRRSSFRLLGATNREPETLKHDLLARLVLHVVIPGLDERREDIPLLVRHLLHRALIKSPEAVKRFFSTTKSGSVEPNVRGELIEALMRYSYRTNIRELEAILWRATSSSSRDVIDLPGDGSLSNPAFMDSAEERIERAEANPMPDASTQEFVKEPTEAEIRAALAEHGGNIVRAAKALELSSRYVLYRWMKKYGI